MNSPAPGALPPNYYEVLHWKITQSRRRLLKVYLLGFPLAVVGVVVFIPFAIRFGRLLEVQFNWTMAQIAVYAVVMTALITVLHELTHGLTAQFYGARPHYGFSWKGLVPYMTTSGYAFTRNQYCLVLLMPLVALSLLAMLGMIALTGSQMVGILTVGAIGNVGGSCGDLGMLATVARYPAQAYVTDQHDGMRVFMPM